MDRFTAFDGTRLAFDVVGRGEPLVCVPGGPGRPARYLGDLGGLATERTLVLLDPRGTGESDEPADPVSHRFDRLADDVDALRAHLDIERVDVLGHSAGVGVVMRFAIDHPDRLRRLILLTPSLRSVDLAPTDDEFDGVLAQRSAEPWYADVVNEVQAVRRGEGDYRVLAPLFYGTWSPAAQAHAAAENEDRGDAAAAGFYPHDTIDTAATRTALSRTVSPVLVYSGELDPVSPPRSCDQLAQLFPNAQHLTQAGAAHYPWIDDGAAVATRLAAFLVQQD